MNIGINDKLDALISLTAKECGSDDVEMFNNLDTSNVSLDKGFYAKQKQIINKRKHVNTVRIVKKWFVRVAVALMALMSLGFLTIMATPDLREALFEVVIEWYDNYISIRYEPIKDEEYETDITDECGEVFVTEEGENESKVPIENIPPTIIEKMMKPSYVPFGLEEDIVVSNNTAVVIDYYQGDDIYFSFNQILFKDNNKLFDSATIIIANIEINGNVASIIEYNGKDGRAIIWTDGIYYYHIQSMMLEIEDLIRIAQSVTPIG